MLWIGALGKWEGEHQCALSLHRVQKSSSLATCFWNWAPSVPGLTACHAWQWGHGSLNSSCLKSFCAQLRSLWDSAPHRSSKFLKPLNWGQKCNLPSIWFWERVKGSRSQYLLSSGCSRLCVMCLSRCYLSLSLRLLLLWYCVGVNGLGKAGPEAGPGMKV